MLSIAFSGYECENGRFGRRHRGPGIGRGDRRRCRVHRGGGVWHARHHVRWAGTRSYGPTRCRCVGDFSRTAPNLSRAAARKHGNAQRGDGDANTSHPPRRAARLRVLRTEHVVVLSGTGLRKTINAQFRAPVHRPSSATGGNDRVGAGSDPFVRIHQFWVSCYSTGAK